MAFWQSSVMTIARLVATSAESSPKLPRRTAETPPQDAATSPTIRSSPSATRSNSTISSKACDSVSCTIAIEATRDIASFSATCASGDSIRRACIRSSAATVCRLFFTR